MNRIIPATACTVALLLMMSMSQLGAQQMQDPAPERAFTVEVRGGYGIPTGDFSNDVGAEADFGFGASAAMMLSRSVGLYAGWARDRFDCEACTGGDRLHVSGWEAGATFMVPGRYGIAPWLRAGAIWHRTSFEFAEADFQTDREWGFQAAFGVDVPIGEWFSLSPAIRYNTVDPTIDVDDFDDADFAAGTVQYLSLDLGLRLHLPRR